MSAVQGTADCCSKTVKKILLGVAATLALVVVAGGVAVHPLTHSEGVCAAAPRGALRGRGRPGTRSAHLVVAGACTRSPGARIAVTVSRGVPTQV